MSISGRQRALEHDRMWEEAFRSPPHDTTSVFDQAAAEGFHPVRVAPPYMFAHEEEIRRLAGLVPRHRRAGCALLRPCCRV